MITGVASNYIGVKSFNKNTAEGKASQNSILKKNSTQSFKGAGIDLGQKITIAAIGSTAIAALIDYICIYFACKDETTHFRNMDDRAVKSYGLRYLYSNQNEKMTEIKNSTLSLVDYLSKSNQLELAKKLQQGYEKGFPDKFGTPKIELKTPLKTLNSSQEAEAEISMLAQNVSNLFVKPETKQEDIVITQPFLNTLEDIQKTLK